MGKNCSKKKIEGPTIDITVVFSGTVDDYCKWRSQHKKWLRDSFRESHGTTYGFTANRSNYYPHAMWVVTYHFKDPKAALLFKLAWADK